MLKHTLPAIVALGTLTACETGKTEKSTSANMPAYRGSAEFQRMKSLAGKWTGESPQMGKMNTEFRVIAGDSVIEERFGAGTPMEMVSMYHDDDGEYEAKDFIDKHTQKCFFQFKENFSFWA